MSIDDSFKELIDLYEELEEIKDERKQKNEEYKKYEAQVQDHLEKNTQNKEKTVDGYRFFVKDEKVTKPLNRENLEKILTTILKDGTKAGQLTNQIWNMRPTELRPKLKVAKPRGKRKDNE